MADSPRMRPDTGSHRYAVGRSRERTDVPMVVRQIPHRDFPSFYKMQNGCKHKATSVRVVHLRLHTNHATMPDDGRLHGSTNARTTRVRKQNMQHVPHTRRPHRCPGSHAANDDKHFPSIILNMAAQKAHEALATPHEESTQPEMETVEPCKP